MAVNILNLKNKKEFLILLILSILFLAEFSLAYEPQLEYPILRVPGLGDFDLTRRIREGTLTLDQLARYIYYFMVIVSGVIAFLVLISGGIKVLTSYTLEGTKLGKEQIKIAVIGLLIILFSWLILVTLDPKLVVLPEFKPSASPLSKEIGVPKKELEDGIIFYTNHPEVPRIEVPYGRIRVEDTARFPVGLTWLDLNGRDDQGQINLINFMCYVRRCPGHQVTNIEIRDPKVQREIGGAIATYNPYRYGVACFEFPKFRGRLRIFFHNPSDPQPLFHIIATPNPIPCGSILVFKIPGGYPDHLKFVDDKIIFYELPYPDREKIHPGLGKRVIVGDCIKLDGLSGIFNEENCSRHYPTSLVSARWGLGWDGPEFVNIMLREELGDLETEIKDPDTDKVLRTWRPRSMEIKPEGKYLVFLFQKTSEPPYFYFGFMPHWTRGYAYWFTSGVDDFNDPKDERLYWIRTPNNENKIITQPGSAIIIEVQEIF